MTWCKILCNDLRGAMRGSPTFQVIISGLFLILGGLIAVGVYTITKDPTNVIAYIMLGVCGICITFIIGMTVCIVGCYPAPVVTSVVTVPPVQAVPSIGGSNPLHSSAPAPAPAPRAPILVTPRATAPSINGSNPMYPNV